VRRARRLARANCRCAPAVPARHAGSVPPAATARPS